MTMNKKICVAISTLNEGIYRCRKNIYELDSRLEIIIVHQVSSIDTCYDLLYKEIKEANPHVKIITSNTRGLSISRNIAISNTTAKYIIFSDDDNSYSQDLYDIVLKTFRELNEPEFVSFRIEDYDGAFFKVYPKQEVQHNKRSILRLSSIENVFNVEFLKTHHVVFNERFGLGAEFPSCEQPIFANSILSKGGIGFFIPKTIAFHPKENSGDDFYSKDSALARKKMFELVFGRVKGRLIYLVFVIKKLNGVPKPLKLSFLRSLYD
ncbi:glycosyltransferase [Vibrio parahaemolyticus]|nr:glycosyltransferase [Vibrio parahaemolyticus]